MLVYQIAFGKTTVHTYRLEIHLRGVDVATQTFSPARGIKSGITDIPANRSRALSLRNSKRYLTLLSPFRERWASVDRVYCHICLLVSLGGKPSRYSGLDEPDALVYEPLPPYLHCKLNM